jgi:hypothetical protein
VHVRFAAPSRGDQCWPGRIEQSAYQVAKGAAQATQCRSYPTFSTCDGRDLTAPRSSRWWCDAQHNTNEVIASHARCVAALRTSPHHQPRAMLDLDLIIACPPVAHTHADVVVSMEVSAICANPFLTKFSVCLCVYIPHACFHRATPITEPLLTCEHYESYPHDNRAECTVLVRSLLFSSKRRLRYLHLLLRALYSSCAHVDHATCTTHTYPIARVVGHLVVLQLRLRR